jgi:hypothetical protein
MVDTHTLNGKDEHQVPVITLAVANNERPLVSGGVIYRQAVLEEVDDVEEMTGGRTQQYRLVEVSAVLRRTHSREHGEEQSVHWVLPSFAECRIRVK